MIFQKGALGGYDLASKPPKLVDQSSPNFLTNAGEIAPSKVTQMIFAVLEDWYHHVVLTHSCELVSFLHIYLLFYCQKSGNKPDAYKKRYSRIRIFTFYLFKAEQYISGRVQNVGCVYYCCCSYYAAARYTRKSRLAVVDFEWRHLNAKPSTRTSVRCKALGDICCTSQGIAHFVLNFVAIATRIGRGKI